MLRLRPMNIADRDIPVDINMPPQLIEPPPFAGQVTDSLPPSIYLPSEQHFAFKPKIDILPDSGGVGRPLPPPTAEMDDFYRKMGNPNYMQNMSTRILPEFQGVYAPNMRIGGYTAPPQGVYAPQPANTQQSQPIYYPYPYPPQPQNFQAPEQPTLKKILPALLIIGVGILIVYLIFIRKRKATKAVKAPTIGNAKIIDANKEKINMDGESGEFITAFIKADGYSEMFGAIDNAYPGVKIETIIKPSDIGNYYNEKQLTKKYGDITNLYVIDGRVK